jgi:hypothetical protein
MSIYNRDFSQIKAAAVLQESKAQAQNVLQATLDEIALLRVELKEARNNTLEKVAAWHGIMAQLRRSSVIYSSYDPEDGTYIRTHENSAEYIRAMKGKP